jgi:hypothetical protein
MADNPFSIVREERHQADRPITLVKTVQTCIACPSQWDAWDAEGQYYYLRHRHGRGSVDAFPTSNVATWGSQPLGGIAHFRGELPQDTTELAGFCEQAGITLSPDAEIITYQQYLQEEGEW